METSLTQVAVDPRRLRLRMTVRGMMIAVALLALASLVGREARQAWLRRRQSNPVSLSRLSARVVGMSPPSLVPGRAVPVSITYTFTFNRRMPPPGTTWLLLASVWFEDMATGRPVDAYSFDAPLTVGDRESASGTFTWDAMLPHPGRYQLHHMLYQGRPGGDMRISAGGSYSIEFKAAARTAAATDHPGATP